MTGSRTGSGIGMAGSGTGALGGKDSLGSAKGNIMVRNGSRMVQGVTKDGKAAKDDKGSENLGVDHNILPEPASFVTQLQPWQLYLQISTVKRQSELG